MFSHKLKNETKRAGPIPVLGDLFHTWVGGVGSGELKHDFESLSVFCFLSSFPSSHS